MKHCVWKFHILSIEAEHLSNKNECCSSCNRNHTGVLFGCCSAPSLWQLEEAACTGYFGNIYCLVLLIYDHLHTTSGCIFCEYNPDNFTYVYIFNYAPTYISWTQLIVTPLCHPSFLGTVALNRNLPNVHSLKMKYKYK